MYHKKQDNEVPIEKTLLDEAKYEILKGEDIFEVIGKLDKIVEMCKYKNYNVLKGEAYEVMASLFKSIKDPTRYELYMKKSRDSYITSKRFDRSCFVQIHLEYTELISKFQRDIAKFLREDITFENYMRRISLTLNKLFKSKTCHVIYDFREEVGKKFQLLAVGENDKCEVHYKNPVFYKDLTELDLPLCYIELCKNTGQTGCILDVETHRLSSLPHFVKHKIGSTICAPLKIGGVLRGMIILESEKRNNWTSSMPMVLEMCTRYVCQQIECIHLETQKKIQYHPSFGRINIGIKKSDFSYAIKYLEEFNMGEYKDMDDFLSGSNFDVDLFLKRIKPLSMNHKYKEIFGIHNHDKKDTSVSREDLPKYSHCRNTYFLNIVVGILQKPKPFMINLYLPKQRKTCLHMSKFDPKTNIATETLFDVTGQFVKEERKRIQLFRKKMTEKQFVIKSSELVHSFLTVLNTMKDTCKVLLNYFMDRCDFDLGDIFNDLEGSMELQRITMNQLVDFEKIDERTDVVVENRFVDLETLLKEVVRMFTTKLPVRNKGRSLSKMIDINGNKFKLLEVEHCYIYTDEWLIKQILVNLIDNALKFTKNGSVEVNCKVLDSANCDSSESRYDIQFEIRDNGIGIKTHETDRLFKKYSHANRDIAKKYGGYGIGLYYCQKLSIALGGDITFTTSYGEGSTFFLKLKNVRAQKASEFKEKKKDVAPKFDTKLKVLFCEDEQILRSIYQNFLADLTVEWFKNGQDCMDYVKMKNIDDVSLVITDLVMPVMDGKELCQKLRDNGFKGKIIALTGNYNTEIFETLKPYGFNAVLSKPLNKDILLSRVHEVVFQNKTIF